MKRIVLTFVVLGLVALPTSMYAAAEIAIKHNGDWVTVTHTTTAEEDTAGLYFQYQECANLCLSQGLDADCSKEDYDAACVNPETPACETFYAKTALGGKQWFMARVIEAALTSWIQARESDIDTRARDYWNALTLAEKEAQCAVWGKAADCTEP